MVLFNVVTSKYYLAIMRMLIFGSGVFGLTIATKFSEHARVCVLCRKRYAGVVVFARLHFPATTAMWSAVWSKIYYSCSLNLLNARMRCPYGNVPGTPEWNTTVEIIHEVATLVSRTIVNLIYSKEGL
jgi:ketopantoate reductase